MIKTNDVANDELPLEFVELRLRKGGYGLQLTAVDEDGERVQLEYKLTHWPANFKPSRLARAWPRWGNSSVAGGKISCDEA